MLGLRLTTSEKRRVFGADGRLLYKSVLTELNLGSQQLLSMCNDIWQGEDWASSSQYLRLGSPFKNTCNSFV